jgi:hypothetical protein
VVTGRGGHGLQQGIGEGWARAPSQGGARTREMVGHGAVWQKEPKIEGITPPIKNKQITINLNKNITDILIMFVNIFLYIMLFLKNLIIYLFNVYLYL